MNTNIENINDTRKKIIVTFSAEEVAEETAKITNEFVRGAKIAGFRPGKAPKAMVEKSYADAIKSQTERTLTSKAIDSMNKIEEFDLYSVVNIEHKNENGCELTFTTDVYPSVDMPKSYETKVELESTNASDEEVNNAIEYYRNQRAKYDEVDREIKKGDFVRLSYTGKIDGESVSEIAKDMPIFADQKSTWEEAGNENAPGVQGIVQGIIGMKKGEKKVISHEFPKEMPIEKLSGKKAEYEVEIFEIREKILPEIDEEFLKGFEAKDLDDLKAKIKQNIETDKKNNNEVMKRQMAVEKLLENVNFPIPETALEDERESILEEMMMRFMSSGASKADIEKNKEALLEGSTKEAEGRAKMRIFLNRVAKVNNLKVDNDDMSRMLWQEAMRTRTKPEDLIKQLKKDPARANRMRSDALLQKAINFIADKCEATVKA
ncbi:MAG: trigger factor [Opitutales bacterium]|nr:trigger factor [Opitutales bacterium]